MKFRTVSAKNEPTGFVSYIEELLDDYLKINPDQGRTSSLYIRKKNHQENKKKICCKD